MSRFDDLFSDCGWPALTDHLGESVVYSDPECEAVTLTAVVSGSRSNDSPGEEPGIVRRTRTRSVLISTDADAVGGGIANPRTSAGGRPVTVTIGDEVWPVTNVERGPGNIAKLTCTSSGAKRIRPGGH
jgi:hypothetical protein